MRIEIDLGRQQMGLEDGNGSLIRTYAVSTSKYGASELAEAP